MALLLRPGKLPLSWKMLFVFSLSRVYAHFHAERTLHVPKLKSLTSLGTKPIFPSMNRVPGLAELYHPPSGHTAENYKGHLHYASDRLSSGGDKKEQPLYLTGLWQLTSLQ